MTPFVTSPLTRKLSAFVALSKAELDVLERLHQRRRYHRFADPGVGPRDNQCAAHGRRSSTCARSVNISVTTDFEVLSVMETRSREVPAGTVGGRMPRMS